MSLDLSFEVVSKVDVVGAYSNGCSGGRSDCCTRVCTRKDVDGKQDSSLQAWDEYLELNAGVLQY